MTYTTNKYSYTTYTTNQYSDDKGQRKKEEKSIVIITAWGCIIET